MAWYVWSFLIVLLCSWLILLYKSLVWLGCCACCRCRSTITRKGVTRDSDGNIVACRFCAIVQQHQINEDAQQHFATPTATLLASPTSSPSLPAPFDIIHDPTAVLPPPVSPLPSSTAPRTAVLYSTPWLVVFSPLHPCAARHLLVIPRQHIDDCNALLAMAAATPQHKRRGGEKMNGSKTDDDSTDGAEDEDDEPTIEADDEEELSGGLRRRRRRWSEEEKELTPHQYISHMLEVGELLLNNPQLLADPNGGTHLTQQQQQQHHNSRLRRWVRRMDCRRGGRRLCRARRRTSRNGRVEHSEPLETGEEEQEEVREEEMESEKQQLLLDTSKPKTNGYSHHAHANGVNGRDAPLLSLSLLSPPGARRRTTHSPYPPSTPSTTIASATTRSNPATPTPVSRTLSSSSPSSSSSGFSALPSPPSHIVGVVDSGSASASTAASLSGQRYCFHVPPHHSIGHLHMHCFELPFDSWWGEWNFRANTRWCKEAETVKREIEQVNKRAVGMSAAPS